MHLGRTGERKTKKQHTGLRRPSEGGSERVLSTDGRLDQAARPRPERAKVPARGRSSESQAQPRRGSRDVANAGKHDNRHSKRGRVQQQAKTGSPRDEARRHQRVKHRHKKISAEANGRGGGASKINSPNSHPSNPVHKTAQDPRPPKRVRFTLPSDEVGQIKATFREPQHEINETVQHETNKTAVIIGVVGVAALLILASR